MLFLLKNFTVINTPPKYKLSNLSNNITLPFYICYISIVKIQRQFGKIPE